MCGPIAVCMVILVLFSGKLTFTQSQKGTGVIAVARISDYSDNGSTRISEEHIPDHKHNTKLSNALNDFPLRRQKRMLIGLGRLATNLLLRGARLVKSNTYVQYYIKPGGNKKALDDFDFVKPVNSHSRPHPLQKGVVMKTGRIGDKNLNVIAGDNTKPPSITIFDNDDVKDKGKGNSGKT